MTPTSLLATPLVEVTTPLRSAVRRLRFTLGCNAATSFAGGVVLAVFPASMNSWLGTGSAAGVRVVGVGLIVFAIDVAAIARSRVRWLARWAGGVSAADGAWVIASAMTIAAGWYSTNGAVTVGAVAAMVAGFSALQLVLARQLVRTGEQ